MIYSLLQVFQRPRVQTTASLFILASTAFLMLFVSWRKWPEVQVDFGMQLYTPWQLSEGKVLYRDIAYLPGGPFSQYWNAMLFKFFGVSLLTLAIANLLLSGVLLLMIFKFFKSCGSTVTSLILSLAVIVVFAFSQYEMGNYNFVTPYSHEVFHGLILGVASLFFMYLWLRHELTRWIVAAGAAYGILFLTKPELFLATSGSLCIAFFLARGKPHFGKSLSLFLAVSAIPSIGFLAYFLQFVSARESFQNVVWAWIPLFTSDVSDNAYYRWCLGMDRPLYNATKMFVYFAVATCVVAVLLWRFRASHDAPRQRLFTVLLLAATILGIVFFDWTDAGRPLPLIVALGLFLLVWRRKSTFNDPSLSIIPALWAVFSLLLLAKMGFHSRIWHYGFILAMPAFLWTCYLLLELLPKWFLPDANKQKCWKRAMMILLLLIFARLGFESAAVYSRRDLPIGEGLDKIYTWNPANSYSAEVASALEWIQSNVNSNQTLAVLPEGAMINYLSRRENPTLYLVFMAEVDVYGMAEMTAAYKKNPPDYVMLLHRETGEYGWDYFGKKKEYGQDLLNWVDENYEPVHRIGYEPLRNGLFGIKILKRNE